MIRVIIGSAVASIAMFVVGFLFFASGLENLANRNLEDVPAASVRQALSANLPGTGTYLVPNPGGSAAQTVMYGQGPIATIHYNTAGFAAEDFSAMILGLGLNFICALLIGTALIGIDRRVPDFGSRARVGVLIAVAASAYNHLGEPIYWHHDWPHFIYLFIADAIALSIAAIIVAWFLPKSTSAGPADAPREV
jgi:hypothetical protein